MPQTLKSNALKARHTKSGRPRKGNHPAGRVKIMEALKTLLAQKAFPEITWGEIAKSAGVSEALIYQYFKTRQGLLYAVLTEYLLHFKQVIWDTLDETQGALNKIRALISGLLSVYHGNRVFARILLLEVRNYPDYFDSQAYALVRELGDKYLKTLEEGIQSGEIRNDVPPARLRQILLGAVEHAILPYVLFQREVDIDRLTREISPVLIDAVKSRA